jgi:exodeoxyribonuclease VII small subunit
MSQQNSIDTKMAKLRELVAWFESDDFSLEKAGEKYEEAAKLAKQIEEDLSKLQNTITVLKEKFDA